MAVLKTFRHHLKRGQAPFTTDGSPASHTCASNAVQHCHAQEIPSSTIHNIHNIRYPYCDNSNHHESADPGTTQARTMFILGAANNQNQCQLHFNSSSALGSAVALSPNSRFASCNILTHSPTSRLARLRLLFMTYPSCQAFDTLLAEAAAANGCLRHIHMGGLHPANWRHYSNEISEGAASLPGTTGPALRLQSIQHSGTFKPTAPGCPALTALPVSLCKGQLNNYLNWKLWCSRRSCDSKLTAPGCPVLTDAIVTHSATVAVQQAEAQHVFSTTTTTTLEALMAGSLCNCW
jgi:hypothetical protein